jgi:hypothetical protein
MMMMTRPGMTTSCKTRHAAKRKDTGQAPVPVSSRGGQKRMVNSRTSDPLHQLPSSVPVWSARHTYASEARGRDCGREGGPTAKSDRHPHSEEKEVR